MEIRNTAPYGITLQSAFKCSVIMVNIFGMALGEVFCGRRDPLMGEHITFCYGLTAYCCGYHEAQCCWDSIWKVWWFWVVVLVVLGALFSCLGYLCTCMNDDRYSSGRQSPFMVIRDSFRRRWSNDGSVPSDYDEQWKDYHDRAVLLPPYYPTTSTMAVSETGTHSAYPDPPPPYTDTATTASETTSLLPVATTSTVLTPLANNAPPTTVTSSLSTN